MRSAVLSKPKPAQSSLTDQILTFCASGRFGIREAIAAATIPGGKTKKRATRQQDLWKAG